MSSVDGDNPELAAYYDKISDYQFELGLAPVDMMKIKAGDSILDIGCRMGDKGRAGKIRRPSGIEYQSYPPLVTATKPY